MLDINVLTGVSNTALRQTWYLIIDVCQSLNNNFKLAGFVFFKHINYNVKRVTVNKLVKINVSKSICFTIDNFFLGDLHVNTCIYYTYFTLFLYWKITLIIYISIYISIYMYTHDQSILPYFEQFYLTRTYYA